MKVLRVSAGLDPAHGGPVETTISSVEAARGSRIETVVAVIDEGPAAAAAVDRLDAVGAPVLPFALSRRAGRLATRWSISLGLARWLLRHADEFDLVHVHGAWTFTTLAGVLAARLRGRPVILTPHESLTDFDLAKAPRSARAVKALLRRVYGRACSAIVFASRLEAASSGGGTGHARAAVIPHPIAATPPLRRPACAGLVVGYLGRLDRKKNVDVLLRALPSETRLRIAGDGPERERLVRVAEAAGVAERVVWHGFVHGEEKREFLASIDVLALPSAFECFGFAAAEALAAGIPVIVSARTGIAELVARHGCGWIVDSTPGPLARALVDARDPAARSERARAAAAATDDLSLELHGRRLRELYEQVLAA